MRTDGGTANAQQGIFMDNGSGGFMTDLTFNVSYSIFLFLQVSESCFRNVYRELTNMSIGG
jgi:hypothetical protein